jgi:hypothetical protein
MQSMLIAKRGGISTLLTALAAAMLLWSDDLA